MHSLWRKASRSRVATGLQWHSMWLFVSTVVPPCPLQSRQCGLVAVTGGSSGEMQSTAMVAVAAMVRDAIVRCIRDVMYAPVTKTAVVLSSVTLRPAAALKAGDRVGVAGAWEIAGCRVDGQRSWRGGSRSSMIDEFASIVY